MLSLLSIPCTSLDPSRTHAVSKVVELYDRLLADGANGEAHPLRNRWRALGLDRRFGPRGATTPHSSPPRGGSWAGSWAGTPTREPATGAPGSSGSSGRDPASPVSPLGPPGGAAPPDAPWLAAGPAGAAWVEARALGSAEGMATVTAYRDVSAHPPAPPAQPARDLAAEASDGGGGGGGTAEAGAQGGITPRTLRRMQRMMHYEISLAPFSVTVFLNGADSGDIGGIGDTGGISGEGSAGASYEVGGVEVVCAEAAVGDNDEEGPGRRDAVDSLGRAGRRARRRQRDRRRSAPLLPGTGALDAGEALALTALAEAPAEAEPRAEAQGEAPAADAPTEGRGQPPRGAPAHGLDTPCSFPPSPGFRAVVIAQGSGRSDDVVFGARDALRRALAMQNPDGNVRAVAEYLERRKARATFNPAECQRGLALTRGNHAAHAVLPRPRPPPAVAAVAGQQPPECGVRCGSVRSMVPVLHNRYVYLEVAVLPHPEFAQDGVDPAGRDYGAAAGYGGGGFPGVAMGLTAGPLPRGGVVGGSQHGVGLLGDGRFVVGGRQFAALVGGGGLRVGSTVGLLIFRDNEPGAARAAAAAEAKAEAEIAAEAAAAAAAAVQSCEDEARVGQGRPAPMKPLAATGAADSAEAAFQRSVGLRAAASEAARGAAAAAAAAEHAAAAAAEGGGPKSRLDDHAAVWVAFTVDGRPVTCGPELVDSAARHQQRQQQREREQLQEKYAPSASSAAVVTAAAAAAAVAPETTPENQRDPAAPVALGGGWGGGGSLLRLAVPRGLVAFPTVTFLTSPPRHPAAPPPDHEGPAERQAARNDAAVGGGGSGGGGGGSHGSGGAGWAPVAVQARFCSADIDSRGGGGGGGAYSAAPAGCVVYALDGTVVRPGQTPSEQPSEPNPQEETAGV